MDEEKKQIDTTNDKPADIGAGDKPKTTPTIDAANKAAERMEAANKKQEELIDRQESIAAEQRLGGIAEAGQPTPPKKVLSDSEYAEALQRGEVNPMREDGFK